MEEVQLVARSALTLVFLVAGAAKLLDLPGSRAAVEAFGVPRRLALPLGTALPVAELSTAALLVAGPTAPVGAAAALVLLLAFAGAIARSMARGEAPDCHCFGQLSSKPAGQATLARNLVLAGLAGTALAASAGGGAPSLVGWIGDLEAAEAGLLLAGLALAALLVLVAWFMRGLLRQNGRLLARIDALEAALAGDAPAPAPDAPQFGLPPGTAAPEFALAGVDGRTHRSAELLRGDRPTLLLFMDPGCGPCDSLLPDVGRWQTELAAELDVVVVSRGSAEANRAKVEEHGLATVLLQEDHEVADLFDSRPTPSGLLVGSDGRVAASGVAGPDAIRDLVASWTGAPVLDVVHAGPAPPVGTRLPSEKRESLDETPVDLGAPDGTERLVLLWNPGCGFCSRIAEVVEAYAGDRELVVVAAGDAEANRALLPTALVVLEDGMRTGALVGAQGTPIAFRVNGDGVVSSGLFVGADEVARLLGEVEATDRA